MSNDKTLLELAAKAAGIEITGLVDKTIVQPDHRAGGFIVVNNRYGESVWNPLTDDGDALRLAVKLQIDLDFYRYKTSVWMKPHDKYLVWDELHDGDPYAATRRAIVRAAAKIGESM